MTTHFAPSPCSVFLPLIQFQLVSRGVEANDQFLFQKPIFHSLVCRRSNANETTTH